MAVGLRAKDTHTLYIRISKSSYVILNKKWVGFLGGGYPHPWPRMLLEFRDKDKDTQFSTRKKSTLH